MRPLNVNGPALSANSNRAEIPIRSRARNIIKSNRKAVNNQLPPIQILFCLLCIQQPGIFGKRYSTSLPAQPLLGASGFGADLDRHCSVSYHHRRFAD